MDRVEDIFNPHPTASDLFAMVAGDPLGHGISRQVFRCGIMKNAVIKFEEAGYYQNVMEFETWKRVEHTDLAVWFAPCHQISPCGRVLIQSYAKDIDSDKKLPLKLPAFFTDIKAENWGIIKGHPVARDYGYHLLMEKGMSARMKKAVWL